MSRAVLLGQVCMCPMNSQAGAIYRASSNMTTRSSPRAISSKSIGASFLIPELVLNTRSVFTDGTCPSEVMLRGVGKKNPN